MLGNALWVPRGKSSLRALQSAVLLVEGARGAELLEMLPLMMARKAGSGKGMNPRVSHRVGKEPGKCRVIE